MAKLVGSVSMTTFKDIFQNKQFPRTHIWTPQENASLCGTNKMTQNNELTIMALQSSLLCAQDVFLFHIFFPFTWQKFTLQRHFLLPYPSLLIFPNSNKCEILQPSLLVSVNSLFKMERTTPCSPDQGQLKIVGCPSSSPPGPGTALDYQVPLLSPQN